MKNFYVICGKSGSGKSTIVDRLVKDLSMKEIKSYTTRPKRFENENTHTFITTKEFKKLKNIVAKTKFDGNYYGITEQQIKDNDIVILDKKGIKDIKKYFRKSYKKNKNKILYIFHINAEESELRKRMKVRGDSDIDIERRIKHDNEKFKGIDKMCHFHINNNDDIDEVMLWFENLIVNLELVSDNNNFFDE